MKSTIPIRMMLVSILFGCAAADSQSTVDNDLKILHPWPMKLSTEEATQQAMDGMREADAGRIDLASAHFQRAAAADPNNAMVHAYLAFTAQSSAEAFAEAAKAKSLSGNASAADRLAIETLDLLLRGETRQALPKAQELTRSLPDNPRSWMILAQPDSLVNGVPGFRRNLEKAIEVAPDYAPAMQVLAYSYLTSDPVDFAKAEKLARRSLELMPNEPAAHDALGDVLRASGRLEEAAKEYTRETELDPTRGDGLQQRGHVNSFLGHYAEARADYQASVAASPAAFKIPLGAYGANVSLFEGNFKKAFDEFEQYYALVDATHAPAPIETKLQIASNEVPIALFAHMGPEMAIIAGHLSEGFDSIAKNAGTADAKRTAEAWHALGRSFVAYAKRDYAAAESAGRDHIRIIDPGGTPEKARLGHQILGMVAYDQKNYAKAVEELKQGDTDDMFTVYYLALAHEGLGHKDDATKLYQRVASYYFNSPGMGIVRNEALKKLKQAGS